MGVFGFIIGLVISIIMWVLVCCGFWFLWDMLVVHGIVGITVFLIFFIVMIIPLILLLLVTLGIIIIGAEV